MGSGSHRKTGHRVEQLASLMKVGLNVVRVLERLAPRDDGSRIGEVLIDTPNN
jgi:hypothetical protein